MSFFKALYLQSPQRNFKKAGEKIFGKKKVPGSAKSASLEVKNKVLDDLFQKSTFGDLLDYKLRSMGIGNFILAGDKQEIEKWNLSSKNSKANFKIINWTWNDELPMADSTDTLTIICLVPLTEEEWHRFSNLKKSIRGKLAILNDLIVPFTRISFLQGKLNYYIKDFDTLIPYYLGQKFFGPLEELNVKFDLKNKRIIEFGPFDGCQTAGLINLGAKSVDSIEVRSENATKTEAAAAAFGWKNFRILMDDFHNVTGSIYGTYDLAFAHGVYYHSIAPFLFLENLTTLSDTIFLGGYCATELSPPSAYEIHEYEGTKYSMKRYVEASGIGAGVNTYAFFFNGEDLMNFFKVRNFEITIISDEPSDVTSGRFLRFLAKRK